MSDKTKHTPAPWFQREQGSEIEIKHGIYTICMVHNFNEPHEVNEANADLIAAAPDMLEALEMVNREIVGPWDDHVWTPEEIALIQSAIKKAKGEL